MKHKSWFRILLVLLSGCLLLQAEVRNVIIVVIDGARWQSTFDAGVTYTPRMRNQLRRKGTLYSEFYNEGLTITVSGHSSILTGTWQRLRNDGSEHPTKPTLFEYFRKSTGLPDSTAYVIAGCNKLACLTHSSAPDYGEPFAACALTNEFTGDLETYANLKRIMQTRQPRLILVNLKEVDHMGHSGGLYPYHRALTQADSLVFLIWQDIQTLPAYRNQTALFITADHGMHEVNPTQLSHGDNCDFCQHIFLLALGVEIPKNKTVKTHHTQRDLAPTIGKLMGFPTPQTEGGLLLKKK